MKRLRQGLDKFYKKGLNGSRILIVGVAYKKDVDDLRESPSMFIWEKLEERGAIVEHHDMHFPVVTPTREHPTLTGRKNVPELTKEVLASYDAVVIATEHSSVDYDFLAANSKLIIDTRNACRNVKDRTHVIKA